MTELMLRTCSADMTSNKGAFCWPESGPVKALDWKPVPTCGQGLHGLLRGVGDGNLLDWSLDAKWLVVEVDQWVDLNGKVKTPEGTVIYCGSREGATSLVLKRYPGIAVVGCTVVAGNRGTATAGHRGTATAGNRGTATAGYRGTATAGYRGTATAGNRGTATAGYRGTATAGDDGTAMAGDDGTATAGHRGTATAGNRGTATAGHRGTATAGDGGTATAGDGGTATAGDDGTVTAGDDGTATAGVGGAICIRWWDGARCSPVIGRVGENGIKPNTPYCVDNTGKLIRA